MTGHELEALRRLLFFSRPEAAEWVGEGVSERAWNRWERGERAVPVDVAARVRELVSWRSDAILTASRAIAEAPGDARVAAVYYTSVDDWTAAGRDPVFWRPHQSALAAVAADDPRAHLVAFLADSYRGWLDGRLDSEEHRAAWAATVSQPAG